MNVRRLEQAWHVRALTQESHVLGDPELAGEPLNFPQVGELFAALCAADLEQHPVGTMPQGRERS